MRLSDFSENLVATGIELGTSGSVVRNSDHYITEWLPKLIKENKSYI
jgi:hypothetical protein